MAVHFVSAPALPEARGAEFGESNRESIRGTVERYEQLFAATCGVKVDMDAVGDVAYAAIDAFAPSLAAELQAMARGANIPAARLAALNARTEILATYGRRSRRGECSTAVLLRPNGQCPVSVQTWDWHLELEDSYFVWTIHYPDGRVVHTLTEFGILGKIGLNSAGIGLHLNLLRHERDGGVDGVPVHVVARAVLESANTMTEALSLIAAARYSASSALTVVAHTNGDSSVVSAEVCPLGPRYVLPNRSGVLVHTNHFLDPSLSAGDREPVLGPDSFARFDVLSRAVAAMDTKAEFSVVAAMASHAGGADSVCCHATPRSVMGDRINTLATISLDLGAGLLRVRPYGPCEPTEWWSPPLDVSGVDASNGKPSEPLSGHRRPSEVLQ